MLKYDIEFDLVQSLLCVVKNVCPCILLSSVVACGLILVLVLNGGYLLVLLLLSLPACWGEWLRSADKERFLTAAVQRHGQLKEAYARLRLAEIHMQQDTAGILLIFNVSPVDFPAASTAFLLFSKK